MSTSQSDPIPPEVPRVIVVDDDADTLSLIGRVLSMMGIDAVPAATCGAARDAAALVRDPDLVIADAILPDGDGVACAADLKARYGCATLILSGSPQPDDPVEGIDGWLTKPADVTELREAVRSLLSGRSAGRQT